MINEIKKEAQERMGKTLEALGHAFAKIRTGRAHPSILDSVMVSYYGSDTPLRQVANRRFALDQAAEQQQPVTVGNRFQEGFRSGGALHGRILGNRQLAAAGR